MKIESAILVITDPNNPRAGELSEIIGVMLVAKEGLAFRLCYKLRFFIENREDFVEISESSSYIVMSIEEMQSALPRIKELEHSGEYHTLVMSGVLSSVFKPAVHRL